MNDVGHDPGGVRRLLPDDDPQRGDRPEQAARPQGRPRRLPGLRRRCRSTSWSSCTSSGADRDKLDPILDACVAVYNEQLDEDGQVDFKGKAKAFVRTYGFLSSILPYTNADWEKLSIFLNFLIPKLPAPKEEDLSKGILETIDMDSYRVEKKAAMKIQLADAGRRDRAGARRPAAAASPSPNSTGSPTSSRPSTTSSATSPWTDADRVHTADHRGHPGRGRRRHGLPERQAELRQAERPDRARQGPGARDDGCSQGRHRAVQAVQRQRRIPAVAHGHCVWDHI